MFIQARIQMGGGAGVQATPFCANFFEMSPKLPKKTCGWAPEPPGPPPFWNPGSASGIVVCYITASAL